MTPYTLVLEMIILYCSRTDIKTNFQRIHIQIPFRVSCKRFFEGHVIYTSIL